MKTIAILFIVVVLALGLGYWLYHSSQKPVTQADQPGQSFAIVSRDHIDPGTHATIPYNSNPPTSGQHYPEPANWGVYTNTLADETLIHNLEHGGIWISYKPSVDADTISKLQDFAKRYQLVVVEPREADDSAIAFAAWGHLQNFDKFDEASMVKFIEAYYNKGPEKVSP